MRCDRQLFSLAVCALLEMDLTLMRVIVIETVHQVKKFHKDEVLPLFLLSLKMHANCSCGSIIRQQGNVNLVEHRDRHLLLRRRHSGADSGQKEVSETHKGEKRQHTV